MNLITIEQCQHKEPRQGSALSRPAPYFLFRRACYLLQTFGPAHTWRKLLGAMGGNGNGRAPQVDYAEEVLNLQPGDLVEVKSEAEIRATLDERGALRGLKLVDDMRRFCGRRVKVHKRMERMFLEESKQYRRLKNTVLLEGSMCEGIGIGCDRSCFFFWREAWLRRVE
ncbi:MAG: hypothetical protein LAO79_15330 [Acidobacteriia bacterium]|nr:hypothetical protein [Terriglobia bacterium]